MAADACRRPHQRHHLLVRQLFPAAVGPWGAALLQKLFDGSGRTPSKKAGKNLRRRKRRNQWEREGWGGVGEVRCP